MNYRSVAAALFLTGVAGLALASALRAPRTAVRSSSRSAEDGKQTAVSRRILPGLGPDGVVRLPNQWALRPAGNQLPLGDFPVNLALHPSGQWLAALHAGYGTHEVILVALQGDAPKSVCRV